MGDVKHGNVPGAILTRRESRKQNVHKSLGEMWESPICVGDGNCVAIVYLGNSGGTSSSREDVEAFADQFIGRYNSHDELVAALKAVLVEWDSGRVASTSHDIVEAIDLARLALAKAGARP